MHNVVRGAAGRTALVAVGRPSPRQTIARALARVGWHVSLATTGEEALAVADADRPDLVVVEAELAPLADGSLPATALARDLATRHGTRLVLVAAQQDPATLALASTVRAARVVVVPREDPVAVAPRSPVPAPTRSVWIVDDSQATRVLARSVFQRAGWDVEEFEDLASVYHRCSTSAAPAAMILDIHLPDGNGLDHVHRFATTGAAVVMVSNLAGPDQLERAFAAGAADVVPKPFDLRCLVARVEHAVRLTPPDVVSHDVVPPQHEPPGVPEPSVFLTHWG